MELPKADAKWKEKLGLAIDNRRKTQLGASFIYIYKEKERCITAVWTWLVYKGLCCTRAAIVLSFALISSSMGAEGLYTLMLNHGTTWQSVFRGIHDVTSIRKQGWERHRNRRCSNLTGWTTQSTLCLAQRGLKEAKRRRGAGPEVFCFLSVSGIWNWSPCGTQSFRENSWHLLNQMILKKYREILFGLTLINYNTRIRRDVFGRYTRL